MQTESSGAIAAQGAAYDCQANIELYWNQLTSVGAGLYVDKLRVFAKGNQNISSQSGFPSITWYHESKSKTSFSFTLWADLIGMTVPDTSKLTTRVYYGTLYTANNGKYIEFSPVGDEYNIYTKTTGYSFQGAMTLYCTSADGLSVTVRTVVLYDSEGNLVTADSFEGKRIDVKGMIDYYSGDYQIKVFSLDSITIK